LSRHQLAHGGLNFSCQLPQQTFDGAARRMRDNNQKANEE